MNTAEIGYYIAFFLDGLAAGFAICAHINLRRVRRTAAEIKAMVED